MLSYRRSIAPPAVDGRGDVQLLSSPATATLLRVTPSHKSFSVKDTDSVLACTDTATTKFLDNEFRVLPAACEARCTMSDFTPEHIGTFLPTQLAEVQFQYAPTQATLLSNSVGRNSGATGMGSRCGELKAQRQRPQDTGIIATTAVALLCYPKSDLSNALQGIVGYFLFDSNTAKRCIEVLHRLGLTV